MASLNLLALAALLDVGKRGQATFALENVDLIFLTTIAGDEPSPSLASTVDPSLSHNVFLLPPIDILMIADPTNIAAFLLFTVVVVVVSNLASRGRVQTLTARERLSVVESLHAFSRKLATARTLDEVLRTVVYQIASMLEVRAVLLLPDNGGIALSAGYPPEETLDEADLVEAKWAWENDRPAGRHSDDHTKAKWLFLPMSTGRRAIGN
jgi:two-component system, OmpR family, sensor histidine kinase KdpD